MRKCEDYGVFEIMNKCNHNAYIVLLTNIYVARLPDKLEELK